MSDLSRYVLGAGLGLLPLLVALPVRAQGCEPNAIRPHCCDTRSLHQHAADLQTPGAIHAAASRLQGKLSIPPTGSSLRGIGLERWVGSWGRRLMVEHLPHDLSEALSEREPTATYASWQFSIRESIPVWY